MISQASATLSSRVPTYIATVPLVDELLRVGADRVGEAALLADLAEQARGDRAAEDRVEDAERVAAIVAARDPATAEADVVLLGLLGIEEQRGSPARRWRRCRSSRPFAERRRRTWPAASSTICVVLDVPGGGDDDVLRRVAGVVIAGDLGNRDRADHLGAPEHPAAERVVAEDRLGEDVVDAVGGLVLVHRDLLEHDLALGVDLVRRQRRGEQHLAISVERVLGVLVEQPRVEVRRLLARRRVGRRAHPVPELGDLDRRVLSVPLNSRCSRKCETPA